MPDQALVNSFSRFAINMPFRYRFHADGGGRPHGGWTRNLSTRGAWVEMPERVAAPIGLEVWFDAPGPELRLAARVAWVSLDPQNRSALHGLRFTCVAPEQQKRLCALVARRKMCPVGRLYCPLAATWQCEAAGNVALPCETRDLSPGGVSLRMPEPMPTGARVQVTIPTAFGVIGAVAQVVWAEPPDARPRGASYRHGLRFLSLNSSSELPLKLLLAGWR